MANFLYLIVVFFILSTSVNACIRCVHRSKAAYFSSDSALSCKLELVVMALWLQLSSPESGHIAAAVPSLYKNGAGCGACVQVRCKNPKLCTTKGDIVMITDLNSSNQTDLVLSSIAFKAMAIPGADSELVKQGIVDIEYQRVPCDYGKKNLQVRVEEASNKPNYLEIKLLNQGGQTEVVAIDVAQVGTSKWGYMRRSHGAVWATDRVPNGALQFRFLVTSGYKGKPIWAKQSVLPANWEAGKIYDTGVYITDIAQEACDPCDGRIWK